MCRGGGSIYFGRCRETQRVSHLLPVWWWPLEGTIGSSTCEVASSRLEKAEIGFEFGNNGGVARVGVLLHFQSMSHTGNNAWRSILRGRLISPLCPALAVASVARYRDQLVGAARPPSTRLFSALLPNTYCNAPRATVAFRLRSQRCRGQERLSARNPECFQIALTVLLLSHNPKHTAFSGRKLEQEKQEESA